jgi:hypothetical protein
MRISDWDDSGFEVPEVPFSLNGFLKALSKRLQNRGGKNG